jgi:hypothetical protein
LGKAGAREEEPSGGSSSGGEAAETPRRSAGARRDPKGNRKGLATAAKVGIDEVVRWEAPTSRGGVGKDPVPREKELRSFGRVFKALDTLEATAAGEDDFSGPILTPLLFAQVRRLWERIASQRGRGDGTFLEFDDRERDDDGTMPAKISKRMAAEVKSLGAWDQWEMARYWEVSETRLKDNRPELVGALLEIRRQVQPVRASLWTLGSKTDDSNADYHHLLALNKLALWRWCSTNPEAIRSEERPQELWREASTTGTLTSFCVLLPPNKQKLQRCLEAERRLGGREGPAAPPTSTEAYWTRTTLEDTAEGYDLMFKEVNQRDKCRNCKGTGHSVMFCKQPRRTDLLCQLCLLGAHCERDCEGSPGVPPHMWARHKMKFISRATGTTMADERGKGESP